MNVPVGTPLLAGGFEWLVSNSHADKGVELSIGEPDSQDRDITAWLQPEQAELLAMCLLVAARYVRAEKSRVAEDKRWRDLARGEA